MKYIILGLKATLTIVLITYLVSSVGWQQIKDTAVSGNLTYLLYSSLFIPLFILMKSFKWYLMVSAAGAKESFLTSLHAMLTGIAFGIFTPARAGEIARFRYYKSIDKMSVAGLVVVDRLIDLFTILILCAYFVTNQIGIVWGLLLVLVAGISIWLLKPVLNIYKSVPLRFRKGRAFAIVERLSSGSHILTHANLVKYLVLSIFIWVVVIIQFYLLINMYYGTTINVAMSALPLIQISNLIPITIAGIGVRENLSVIVLSIYGVPEQVSAVCSFSLYLIDIMLPGIIGLVLFGFERKEKRFLS